MLLWRPQIRLRSKSPCGQRLRNNFLSVRASQRRPDHSGWSADWWTGCSDVCVWIYRSALVSDCISQRSSNPGDRVGGLGGIVGLGGTGGGGGLSCSQNGVADRKREGERWIRIWRMRGRERRDMWRRGGKGGG